MMVCGDRNNDQTEKEIVVFVIGIIVKRKTLTDSGLLPAYEGK